ncbi:MAG: 1-acyl-sn-glycerol-3-phosphate acyltransferase [Pseudomonas sp.]|uniref:1-acyl-sn-glycerol-3-phosphate acyltransferase n=1 Tax=Pseudomonas sp. TaxID=306 RepID=UPI003D105D26
MMGEFDAIRPYADAEVPAVLDRLLADEVFLDILTRFRFPKMAGTLGWLLKPLIAYRLRFELRAITSVSALQDKIEPYVDRSIEQATDGVTYSGVEGLRSDSAHLFLANHRDIVMDPAFVNYAVYHAGLQTPRIAIGDNLLQKPFVSDLMRLNKSFIVHRSISGRREKLAAYQLLSAYINHSIRNDGESIWIAQAEGRAKDGDDRTDSAILKMFHMSRKDEPFADVIGALKLTPVSISYEYDPCDQAKARELFVRATTGSYEKAPGEDDKSIALGITGYKGRVHIHFGVPVSEAENLVDSKQLAVEMDRRILSGYRLFPVHYLAYAMWSGRDPALNVPDASDLFSVQELAAAQAEWDKRLAACPLEQQPYLVLQYANPVRNQYRIKAGLPL